jgi:cation diffusion facilitator CzcD-associated flavoprotein CzcO
MCDVESYIYLPMLEEMGYMPKHKYSYGSEIRQYVNMLAEKYGIAERAMFRTKVNSLDWDDTHKEWIVKMTKERKDRSNLDLTVRSQFVMAAAGLLLHPKLPNIPGIETFKGHSFHTSRWDYAYTGGTPENPDLVNLKDKRVGIVGTGATAIQAVPHLAKWAKELVVLQRTASQVDVRGQHETDPDWWKKETDGRKGWQRERVANFNGHLTGALPPDAPNLVGDEWSKMRAYPALIGRPGIIKMEDIPSYVADLHARDIPRSERIRARCDEVVKDKETAEHLKSWFPSWCKRPTFHDDYLQCFNQPNVKLIDTNGQGIASLTEIGPVYEGKEYPLDLLIWSTGFRAPATGSPAFCAGMTITGRNGLSMDQKWQDDLGTLHGVVSRDFPNLFWPGPWQAAASANFTAVLEVLTSHTAHILAEAEKYAAKKKPGTRYSVEPSREAEQAWGLQVQMRAAAFAGTSGCTPSYFNREGLMDRMPMEQRMKFAKMAIWGEGIDNFTEVLEKWEDEGKLEGLVIEC